MNILEFFAYIIATQKMPQNLMAQQPLQSVNKENEEKYPDLQ